MDYVWNLVSPNGNSLGLLLLLAASAVKAALLLAVIALVCSASRRAAAATRHTLWTMSLCAVFLFPFFSVFRVWEVPVLPAQISSSDVAQAEGSLTKSADSFPSSATRQRQNLEGPREIDESRQRASDFPATTKPAGEVLPAAGLQDVYHRPQNGAQSFAGLVDWALAIWFAGVVILLLRLLLGYTATMLLTRRAAEFKDPPLNELFSSLLLRLQLKSSVRLLRSCRTPMPVVCGVLRPTVLLPAGAEDWPEERREMVLLHELKHVSRKDCLTQLLAQAACAFYWFNPLVWYAARRLRVEREQACDDYVLSIGAKPSDYAHHLLDIARSLRKRAALEWSHTTTVAMARQSQLEGRLLAILSKEGGRRTTSQAMAAGIASLVCTLFLALALVQPTAVDARNPRPSQTSVADESFGQSLDSHSEPGVGATIQRLKPQVANSGDEGSTGSVEESRGQAQAGEPLNYLKTDDQQGAGPDPFGDAAHQTEEVSTPESAPASGPFIKPPSQQDPEPRQDKSGDFIDEMASVGYTNLSVDELIRLKSAGVSAEFVKSLAALGFNHLTTKELTSFANNGITPAYIKEIRAAGYNDLSAREITSFRNNGVTAEYIKALRDAGYGNLPAKQLISFAANDVT